MFSIEENSTEFGMKLYLNIFYRLMIFLGTCLLHLVGVYT